MGWQDYIVWGIVLSAAFVVLRRLFELLTGRRRSRCASCEKGGCPFKNDEKR